MLSLTVCLRWSHALCFMLHCCTASDGCCSAVTPGSRPRHSPARTRAQYRAPEVLPPGRSPARRVLRPTLPGSLMCRSLLRLTLPGRLMWRRLLRLTLPGRLMWRRLLRLTLPGSLMCRRLLRLTLPGRLMCRLLSSASQQATPEQRLRFNSGNCTPPSCASSARPRVLWPLLRKGLCTSPASPRKPLIRECLT